VSYQIDILLFHNPVILFIELESFLNIFRIILCLPSNATHILQPLDVVFFNPLKIEWKKYVSLLKNVLIFSPRILKAEYTRTNNKVIGKARFPSLLMELWKTDPIKTKTNIVKSFIKAGVFPFNPNSIDKSRILKNCTSINTSSSNTFTNTSNASNHDQSIHPSASSSCRTLDNNSHANNSHQPITNTISSPQLGISSFSSSHEAISALDRVLEETQSNESNDDDDSDEEYLPNKSISTSSTTLSSIEKEKSQSKILPAVENHQPLLARKGTKRRKKSSRSYWFQYVR
jgi:hypothetical protein